MGNVSPERVIESGLSAANSGLDAPETEKINFPAALRRNACTRQDFSASNMDNAKKTSFSIGLAFGKARGKAPTEVGADFCQEAGILHGWQVQPTPFSRAFLPDIQASLAAMRETRFSTNSLVKALRPS